MIFERFIKNSTTAGLLATTLLAGAASADVDGLLRIHPTNPRFLINDSGEALMLSGSHNWSVFQNYRPPGGALETLNQNGTWLATIGNDGWGHNFTRGWVFEDSLYEPKIFTDTGGVFDLSSYRTAFVDRLKSRIGQAEDEGLYISVMLFQGWSVEDKGGDRNVDPWPYHPFNVDNNLTTLPGGDVEIDGADSPANTHGKPLHSLTHSDSNVLDLQKAYVEHIVTELNEYDNIIWEITNESVNASSAWQSEMIAHIRSVEQGLIDADPLAKRHLVWMSCSVENNAQLFVSDADIVAPCKGLAEEYVDDPPASDGSYVVFADTDHLKPTKNDATQIWRSFTRGQHPQLMDFDLELTWWAPNPNLPQSDNEDMRDAITEILKLVAGEDVARMAPQDGGTSPSDSGFALYTSTGDLTLSSAPSFDGTALFSFVPNGVADVEICNLHDAATYTAKWYRPNGTLNGGVNNNVASSGGCATLSKPNANNNARTLYLQARASDRPKAAIAPPDPAIGPAPLVVDLDASSSSGSNLVYAWDFGDGMTAVGAVVDHLYIEPGVYYPRVVVTDDVLGLTDVAFVQVVVEAPALGGPSAIVRDSFATNPGSLVQRPAELGGVEWIDESGKVKVGNGGLRVDPMYAGAQAFGYVPVEVPLGEEIIVSADMTPFTDPDGGDYNAVGFATTSTSGMSGSNGQLWMRIRQDGKYWVRYNGGTGVLAQGTLSPFVVTEQHRLEIGYDPLSNEMWASIDGELVQPRIDLDNADPTFTPDIHYAGIHMQKGTESGVRIRDFEVRTTHSLFRDSFGAGSGNLSEWTTEQGELQWIDGQDRVQRDGGGLKGVESVTGKAFVSLTETLEHHVMTLRADMEEVDDDTSWDAVGFSSESSGGLTVDNGQFWFQLGPADGEYKLRYDGLNELSVGNVSIAPGEQRRVELQYDPLSNKVRASFAGQEIQPWTDLDDPDYSFVPDIEFAAVQLQQGSGTGSEKGVRIHDMELGVTGAVFRDSFEDSIGYHSLGTWLTQVGEFPWTATGDLVVEDGGVELDSAVDSRAFVNVDSKPMGHSIRMVATVRPPGATDGDWLGVGLTNDDTSGLASANGLIWVKFEASSQLIKARPPGGVGLGSISQGTLGNPDEVRVEIVYDPLANEASVWVEGILLQADVPVSGEVHFAALDIRTDVAGETLIDDVEVTVE